jgi:hypothetical protein
MSAPRAISRAMTIARMRKRDVSGSRRLPGSGEKPTTCRFYGLVPERCGKQHEELMSSHYPLTRAEYEKEIDVTLSGSFPASDPPSWTLGASPWMEAPAGHAQRGRTADPGPHESDRQDGARPLIDDACSR